MAGANASKGSAAVARRLRDTGPESYHSTAPLAHPFYSAWRLARGSRVARRLNERPGVRRRPTSGALTLVESSDDSAGVGAVLHPSVQSPEDWTVPAAPVPVPPASRPARGRSGPGPRPTRHRPARADACGSPARTPPPPRPSLRHRSAPRRARDPSREAGTPRSDGAPQGRPRWQPAIGRWLRRPVLPRRRRSSLRHSRDTGWSCRPRATRASRGLRAARPRRALPRRSGSPAEGAQPCR